MDLATDYKSWLKEEKLFLDAYKKTFIYDRYEVIFSVLDNLCEQEKLEEDEELIFKTGAYFLESQISELKIWASAYYNNDLSCFFKNSKTILLMLFVNEHLSEMENFEGLDKLHSLEQDVFCALKNRTTVTESLYNLVTSTILNLYKINKANHEDLTKIFTDIAKELKIDLY